jgi:GntR family transcriptional repressor for pyruvate dehydrogenase complex
VRHLGSEQLSEPLDILLKMHGFTLDHMHHVRSVLEIDIAAVAAARATQEDVIRLGQIVDRMEAVYNDPKAYAEADNEFHLVLAHTSHNPLMVMLLESIAGLVRELRNSIVKNPEIYAAGLPDHRQILKQVEARNKDGAREAMRRHLERARQIQERSLEESRKLAPEKTS